jgi:ISXO2-like transposase domain
MGTMKFNKGRRVEGHWVLGMIDVETGELRIALCKNNHRSEAELLPWIEAWVEKGTTIYSDCWKAYGKLESMGYKHETVNHSQTFVRPDGMNTNKIESNWRPLKDYFREIKIRSVCSACQDKFEEAKRITEPTNPNEPQSKENEEKRKKLYRKIREERGSCEKCQEYEQTFGLKLTEYLWRRENKKNGHDPFERLLEAIRHCNDRVEDSENLYTYMRD